MENSVHKLRKKPSFRQPMAQYVPENALATKAYVFNLAMVIMV